MKQKLFCPHCGRCLGEGIASDFSGEVSILKTKPFVLKQKHFIHDMKCLKCKQQVFIVMQFDD